MREPHKSFWAGLLLLTFLLAAYAFAEQIEFSTFYPTAPAGGGGNRGQDAAFGTNFQTQDPGANNLIVEGQIGIGTNNPIAALNIQAGGSAAAPAFVFGNDADTGIYYGGLDAIAIAGGGRTLLWLDGGIMPETIFYIRSGHDFQIVDDQNSVVRLAVKGSSGNVGIGTGNPDGKLEVKMAPSDYGGVAIYGDNFSGSDSATRLKIKDTSGNVDWFLSANNDGKFAINQGGTADRLVVDNADGNVSISGNVGIGGSSGHKLAVMGGPNWTSSNWKGNMLLDSKGAIAWKRASTTDPYFGMGYDSSLGKGFYMWSTASNPGDQSAAATYRFQIDPSGDTTIYGSEGDDNSSTLKIVTAGSPTTYLLLDSNEIDSNGHLYLQTNTGQNLIMATGGGDVGIGTSSPANKLHVSHTVNNDYAARIVNAGGTKGHGLYIKAGNDATNVYPLLVDRYDGTNLFYVKGSGAAWLKGALTENSDLRSKENIGYFNDGLDQVTRLKPVRFDFIDGEKNQLGFVGQEVQPVIPEAVTVEEDGRLGLKKDFIIPYLVNAIKELKAENDALKKRLEVLEKKVK